MTVYISLNHWEILFTRHALISVDRYFTEYFLQHVLGTPDISNPERSLSDLQRWLTLDVYDVIERCITKLHGKVLLLTLVSNGSDNPSAYASKMTVDDIHSWPWCLQHFDFFFFFFLQSHEIVFIRIKIVLNYLNFSALSFLNPNCNPMELFALYK